MSAEKMFNAANVWSLLRPASSRNERREEIRRLIFHPHLTSGGMQSPSGAFERHSSAPELARSVENDWSQRGPRMGISYSHARDQLKPRLSRPGKGKYQLENITKDARANTLNLGLEPNEYAPAAGLLHPRSLPDLPSSCPSEEHVVTGQAAPIIHKAAASTSRSSQTTPFHEFNANSGPKRSSTSTWSLSTARSSIFSKASRASLWSSTIAYLEDPELQHEYARLPQKIQEDQGSRRYSGASASARSSAIVSPTSMHALDGALKSQNRNIAGDIQRSMSQSSADFSSIPENDVANSQSIPNRTGNRGHREALGRIAQDKFPPVTLPHNGPIGPPKISLDRRAALDTKRAAQHLSFSRLSSLQEAKPQPSNQEQDHHGQLEKDATDSGSDYGDMSSNFTESTDLSLSEASSAQDFSTPLARILLKDIHCRVMDKVADYFQSSKGKISHNNGNYGSGEPSSSSTVNSQRSPNSNQGSSGMGKQPAGQGDPGKSNGGNDGDSNNPKRPLDQPPTSTHAEPKFACPYFKYNPAKYPERICNGTLGGWPSIHRLKEHLYRRHRRPILSHRCLEVFEKEAELKSHLEADTVCAKHKECGLRDDRFDQDQEAKLRRRKWPKGTTEDEKWRRVYLVLFPDVSEEDIPSPYVGDDVHTGCLDGSAIIQLGNILRMQVPRQIEDGIRSKFERMPLDIFQQQLPIIVQDAVRAALLSIPAFHAVVPIKPPAEPQGDTDPGISFGRTPENEPWTRNQFHGVRYVGIPGSNTPNQINNPISHSQLPGVTTEASNLSNFTSPEFDFNGGFSRPELEYPQYPVIPPAQPYQQGVYDPVVGPRWVSSGLSNLKRRLIGR